MKGSSSAMSGYKRRFGRFQIHIRDMECTNRERLLVLYQAGVHIPKVLHQITNIPLRTIYNNLPRVKQQGRSGRMPGGGRPPSLDANNRRRVSSLAHSHPLWSAQNIANKVVESGGPLVCSRTIQRYLKAVGYLKLMPKKIPDLTPIHKEKRV